MDHHAALSQAMQELIENFQFQKSMGVDRYDISDHTRRILQKWGSGSFSAQAEPVLGPPDASVVLIDGRSRFFDGESGDLLVRILGAMHLDKEDVLVLNGKDIQAVKRSIRQGRPRVIITLGSEALQHLFGKNAGVEIHRGKFQRFMGVKVMPTLHPETLLSDASKKRELWEDMKKVMAFLGL